MLSSWISADRVINVAKNRQIPGRYWLMFGPELTPTPAYAAEHSPGRQALLELARGIERCQAAAGTHRDHDPLWLSMLPWSAVHGAIILRLDRPGFP